MAGFFGADRDELETIPDDTAQELSRAKAVAALAVAQARRSELALREALASGACPDSQLAALMAGLEEDRARAREQIAGYRDRERRADEALDRLGEMRRVAELNEERENLRELVSRTEAAMDETALEELEDEIMAEAARLDTLQVLDRGDLPPPRETGTPPGEQDVRARAVALLEQDAYGGVLHDGADT